jgi:hypothetical protein
LYLRGLIHLPALALTALVLADVRSLFLPSPFRESCEPLWTVVMRSGEAVHAFLVLAAGAGLATFNWTICNSIQRFLEATTHLVQEYARRSEDLPDAPVVARRKRLFRW